MVRRAIISRQESEEEEGDCAPYWVGGEKGVDDIEDTLWIGGEDGDGRLTTCRKNHFHRIILRWTPAMQLWEGRNEGGKPLLGKASTSRPFHKPETSNFF